jgi:sulfatase modifying factor 1
MNPAHLFPSLSLTMALALAAQSSLAAERVALVIGNNAYTHARPLKTAVADAEAVTKTLRDDLGFHVISRTDATRDDLPEAVTEFLTAAKDAKAVLVYFAGHGVESAALGENFLVPVDAVLEKEAHLESQAYSLNTLLARLKPLSAPVRLVVLDCCRNNPLEGRSWAGGRGEAGLGALDLQRLDGATMVVYSASPGKVARDSVLPSDKHSPFAAALLTEMARPGATAFGTFASVETTVFRATGETQRPKSFFSGSLAPFNDFVFRPGDGSLPPPVPVPMPRPAPVDPFAGRTAGQAWENGQGTAFRWCPPGEFWMGSSAEDRAAFNRDGADTSDEPQHKVRLTRGFWLSQHETTQGEWAAIMGRSLKDQARLMLQDDTEYTINGKKTTLRAWRNAARDADPAMQIGVESPSIPIYFVSWAEAEEYCRLLTERERRLGKIPAGWRYALPTEAQWEYACRAGTETALYNGGLEIKGTNNGPALDPIAWYGGNSSVGYNGQGWDTANFKEKQYPGGRAGPRRVGQKEANAWGLHDTIGNLFEWCADWYGPYPEGAATDPSGPAEGVDRVYRGGSWLNGAARCRAASRYRGGPGNRIIGLGFRPALVPSDQ